MTLCPSRINLSGKRVRVDGHLGMVRSALLRRRLEVANSSKPERERLRWREAWTGANGLDRSP
jgi:hypothetical protein